MPETLLVLVFNTRLRIRGLDVKRSLPRQISFPLLGSGQVLVSFKPSHTSSLQSSSLAYHLLHYEERAVKSHTVKYTFQERRRYAGLSNGSSFTGLTTCCLQVGCITDAQSRTSHCCIRNALCFIPGRRLRPVGHRLTGLGLWADRDAHTGRNDKTA
jgi:hypothetical protein